MQNISKTWVDLLEMSRCQLVKDGGLRSCFNFEHTIEVAGFSLPEMANVNVLSWFAM